MQRAESTSQEVPPLPAQEAFEDGEVGVLLSVPLTERQSKLDVIGFRAK